MKSDADKKTIQERFHHLLSVISSDRFIKKQGLNNDIPFFICPYPPEESNDMERLQKQLVNKLSLSGIRVLVINLYDLSIEILKQNGDWGWYLSEEPKMTKAELIEDLQSILDIENVLTPTIADRMREADFDVMFISGVGEVFPYIRSHNILNNLQSTAKDQPTVMFFPGAYTHSIATGASLDLFNRLHDDKYYRAFNIYHYAI